MDDRYLAGWFDGEGCISIVGASLRVYVSNTYRPTLAAIQKEFGGRLAPKKMPAPARPAFEWSCYGDKAEAVLRRVLPYLREKLSQAALGIEYHNTPRRSDRRGEIKAELRRLKRPIFLTDGTVRFGPVVQ